MISGRRGGGGGGRGVEFLITFRSSTPTTLLNGTALIQATLAKSE